MFQTTKQIFHGNLIYAMLKQFDFLLGILHPKKRQQTQTVSEIMLQSLPESLVRSSRLWLSFRSPAAW